MKPIYTNINIKPGVLREATKKAAEGHWYDADKVRFRYGRPEKIGGWANINGAGTSSYFEGIARAIHNWNNNDGSPLTALGTHTHLYLWQSGTYYDITPVVASGTTVVSYTTSAGSSAVLVSLPSHGFIADDIIYFSTAIDPTSVTAGGNVLMADQFIVTSVVDTHRFYIEYTTAALSTKTVSVTTTWDKLVHLGQQQTVLGTGWGSSFWSHSGGWGTPVSGDIQLLATQWTLDSWGEDLVANYRGGAIFQWVENSGVNIRAVSISGAPTRNDLILVSPEDRHLISFGTEDVLTSTYSPVLIRWCASENLNDWSPSATNTAGDKLLSGSSRIVGATRTRGAILVWTEAALYSMRQIGQPFIFGFDLLGSNCGLVGPHAAIEANGRTYWMSNQRFMVFDGGAPRPLPCTVLRYIFDNIDGQQYDKVYAGVNGAYNEIIWLYQDLSATTAECNRYVIYNYLEDHWTIGSIDRTVWADDSVYLYPLAADTSGNTYYHDYGDSADGDAIYSYLRSGEFDLQDGQQIAFINRIVPDFTLKDGDPMRGNITITLRGRKAPGDSNVVTRGPYTVSAGTLYVPYRHRARQISMIIESSSDDPAWRMGEMKMRLMPDGEH
mgnify:CR=1 FL=1